MTNDKEFGGKVALVTGGSRRMGRAICFGAIGVKQFLRGERSYGG